jgi:hypothetical protein
MTNNLTLTDFLTELLSLKEIEELSKLPVEERIRIELKYLRKVFNKLKFKLLKKQGKLFGIRIYGNYFILTLTLTRQALLFHDGEVYVRMCSKWKLDNIEKLLELFCKFLDYYDWSYAHEEGYEKNEACVIEFFYDCLV